MKTEIGVIELLRLQGRAASGNSEIMMDISAVGKIFIDAMYHEGVPEDTVRKVVTHAADVIGGKK